MYLSYWGLRESPFRGTLDPRWFYQSATHEEALARLNFLVDERRRMGLLLGEPGIGKSLLLEYFARSLRRAGCQTILTSIVGASAHEMLWTLASQLGAAPSSSATLFTLWRAVADRIVENRYQQVTTVLLLDDADRMSDEVRDQLCRLAQTDTSPDARLTLILAAQHRRVGRLGAWLLDLAELRIDLDPWEPAETAAYLVFAMRQAGRPTRAFSDAGTERLHQLAQGIPRRVKQLADLALLAAAASELLEIDADIVESVFEELGTVRPTGERASALAE